MKKRIIFLYFIFYLFFINNFLSAAGTVKEEDGAVIGKFTLKILNNWVAIQEGRIFNNLTLHINRGPNNDTILIQTRLKDGIFYLKNLKPGVSTIESFSFEHIDSGVDSTGYYSIDKASLNIKFLVFDKNITVLDSVRINAKMSGKKYFEYNIGLTDEKEMLKKFFIGHNSKKYSNYEWNEIDFTDN